MTPINFHKKEKPLTSLVSMGGGAAGMQFGGGVADKTYIDDVFSTTLYRGTGNSGLSISNGIDLAGEGGMVWAKSRSNGDSHWIVDTVRGLDKSLKSNSNAANNTASGQISSFNNTGFTLGNNHQGQNYNGFNYGSWTFRKQKGFFDIVTWDGDGTTSHQIAHNLGSVPGCILVKCYTNSGSEWMVYHSDIDITDAANYRLLLDQNVARVADTGAFNNTAPTATHFTVGDGGNVNTSGRSYVAYLLAGGPSSGAGAHSINFPAASGTVRRILCGDASNKTADFNFGTGDLTIECWMRCNGTQGTYPRVVAIGPQWEAEMAAIQWDHDENANKVSFYCYNHSSSTTTPLLRSSVKAFNGDGQWHHVAVTRNGDTWRLFVDGNLEDDATWTGSPTSANSYCTIGNTPGTATTAWFGGYISNVRIVKGTAVYTSSFRVPTNPLSNITNTKLLCCNNLSGTSATVTPIALTETNIIQNQTYSPFDDSAGFKFGEEGDENIVKCGSYTGNGSTTGPEVYVGWEPQWVLIKNANAAEGWRLFDSMRGISTGYADARLFPNNNDAESAAADYIDLSSTGFRLKDNGGAENGNGNTMLYVAIRRPDGYVGKLPSAATGSFHMLPSPAAGIPWYRPTDFPVDMSFSRQVTGSHAWDTGARIIQGRRLQLDNSGAEASGTYNYYDYQDGWNPYTGSLAGHQAWMWKRGAGFDIVTWDGNGVVRRIQHSLGQAPEFMIVRRRSGAEDWTCYHKGLNGGTNPSQWYIQLNAAGSQTQYTDYDPGNPGAYNMWNYEDPTSTHITIGRHDRVNTSGQTYMAMLFSSANDVDSNPISKVGSYTGSASEQTITLGFQPRFVIIKRVTGSQNWLVLDTTRGWGSGNDSYIYLNSNAAQGTDHNFGAPTSNGFTVTGDSSQSGGSGTGTYIYYAHA